MITKEDFMLCESITEGELNNLSGEYKANLKMDGERLMGIKIKGNIFLINRAGRIKNHIYPEIIPQINEIEGEFILDGEIITEDEIFNSLQHRSNLSAPSKIERAKKEYPIKYMVFDILHYNGEDLRQKPLKDRVELLKEKFNKLNLIEYGNIDEMLSLAKSKRGEGIVIKNMLSPYESKRSKNWLKLKLFKEDLFRAIRYIENPAGIRCEDDKLNAVQVAGKESREVKNLIDNEGYCDLVIQYLEKTKENRYRNISFRGIADVKN